ncbi:rad51 homolog C [Ectocarpus siliculosus]|uniref:DNA repair protein RAD51 homolog 3 n=1 Tax=Ectocarpus siliculosus TaxID=2880 RepID=D7G8V6_ECTSI|nr:rad51 homolog C [Ectocarpus siliculosus]|eukprot:CBJ28124.1 rad51 homolog C [Ectocarpus siliculosus]
MGSAAAAVAGGVLRGGLAGSQAGASARELIVRGRHKKPIITFCREIDGMMGGGVPRGELTEVCGTPGVGKTQFGMQLAVDVQIPHQFGGVGGGALYIDTEGSLTVERLSQLCSAVVEHLQKIARNKRKQGVPDLESAVPTQEAFLGGIHVWRLHDHAEQLAAVRTLPEFLVAHPEVKLVVMDSVAFHFRHAFQDMSVRTRMLSRMAQQLNEVAQAHSLAVVLVNQMTTKVMTGHRGESSLVPALGESWAHAATNRLLLLWKGQERFAELLKSPRLRRKTVPFSVVGVGIRDTQSSRAAAAAAAGATAASGGGSSSGKRSSSASEGQYQAAKRHVGHHANQSRTL